MKTIAMLCIVALCLTTLAPVATADEPDPTSPSQFEALAGDCVEIDSTYTPPRITVDPSC